jgi:glycosyltransferase involved in cell wall biosynthesis
MKIEVADKEFSVSIVIRTRDRLEYLKKCINSILAINYCNYNVVIINDASRDNTREFLEEHYGRDKRFIIVNNDKHVCSAHALNLGVLYSTGEIIAFTDDDSIVDKNWLKEMTKPYLHDLQIMAVGGASYIEDTDRLYGGSEYIWGCNMSFRACIFKGFIFDTNLKYSHYYDEADLINRIKLNNYKIKRIDTAIIRHFSASSTYRRLLALEGELNRIYMETKQISLVNYYCCKFYRKLGKTLFLTKDLFFKEHQMSLCEMVKKVFFLVYVLFFEIPIKAKIKHKKEETLAKKFKNSQLRSHCAFFT